MRCAAAIAVSAISKGGVEVGQIAGTIAFFNDVDGRKWKPQLLFGVARAPGHSWYGTSSQETDLSWPTQRWIVRAVAVGWDLTQGHPPP
jgi:hypothetical protein